MTQLCRLTVKVTVQGHGIYPVILYLTPIERFSFKLWSNVNLNETGCRAHDSAIQTQGQGHTSRSWDLPINFGSAPYLLNPSNDFHLISPKYSSQCDDVQNLRLSSADSRSRSYFMFMYLPCNRRVNLTKIIRDKSSVTAH